jgi:RNA polymerase sigma-54 factor
MIRQGQQLGQKQLLKLSPQQIQLLNFLQLNTLELEQRIQDELGENPALEATGETTTPAESEGSTDDGVQERLELLDQYHHDDDPADRLPSAPEPRSVASELPDHTQLSDKKDFREQLQDQLALLPLNERERLLTQFLVDSLDDDGYLRQDLGDLADTLSFAHELMVEDAELEAALDLLQDLEPAGIGARDLRECLLLQLEAKHHAVACVDLAYRIVEHHLHDLGQHNYDKIRAQLNTSPEELRCAISLIERLSPRPAGGNTRELVKNQHIIPEFVVEQTDNGEFTVALAQSNSAALKLSPDMLDSLDALQRTPANKQEKAATQYLRSKVESARWFIDMVRQREQSMLQTMQTIVALQPSYFRSGDLKDLRPMVLRDVAERVGLDISTVSRVTSTKYAHTDFGVVHLRSLFNQGMAKSDGEMVTNKEISDLLSQLVGEEDKTNPLTDQDLADRLEEHGYPVARRTVAKYRDLLHIPVAKNRRTF